MDKITEVLKRFIGNQEISGAVCMVRKDGEIVYDSCLGYADIDRKLPMTKKSIFRMCSMTKPLIGIAIMQLVEQGKIDIYDKVSKYIPEFRNLNVCKTNLTAESYEADIDDPTGMKAAQSVIDSMEFVPAKREITIFDLLTHSSGLGQGPYGQTLSDRLQGVNETSLERSKKYAKIALDFQPGEGSGYSPVVGMEVLSAIISEVSGEEIEEYLKSHIFMPLGITTLKWVPNEKELEHLVRLYEYTPDGGLVDVTDNDYTWRTVDAARVCYKSAAAGIIGSVEDYEKIAHMLLNKGSLNGIQILKPETVEMMAGKGIPHTSVLTPGGYWGLSMAVFEEPEKCKCKIGPNSFGWSGAFGTHFYVDFKNALDMVLGINRSNIGGASSYVSRAVEKAITETYGIDTFCHAE